MVFLRRKVVQYYFSWDEFTKQKQEGSTADANDFSNYSSLLGHPTFLRGSEYSTGCSKITDRISNHGVEHVKLIIFFPPENLYRRKFKKLWVIKGSQSCAIIVFYATQFVQYYISIEAQRTPLSPGKNPISVSQTAFFFF